VPRRLLGYDAAVREAIAERQRVLGADAGRHR